MLLRLFPWPVFLLAYSEFTVLPSPHNVKMDAVNTQYIMRWDWNHSLANHNVTFTAQYTFSNQRFDEGSYSGKCIRITEERCDFSRELDLYVGSYILRVRAEGRGQMSNWSCLKFVPDEDAALGPPSHVALDPGDAMVTVSFRKPMKEQDHTMRSMLDSMSFSLQYWEKHPPSKKQENVFDTEERTLFFLKPWTEYCMQVSAFIKLSNKTSPYTPQQCVRTLGKRHPPVWQVLLALLCCVTLMTVPICRHYKKRKSIVSKYTFPSSILHNTQDQMFLLLPREESCVATAVVAVQVEQTSQGEQQQVKGQRDVEAEQDSGSSSIQRGQGSSSHDSGIYSGEDSGKRSVGSTTTSQPEDTLRKKIDPFSKLL